MTHKQHPIGTGFTPASTVDDVLAGIDLTGKNVVVTGGHSGLGLVVTRALAKAGASVTVGSRNPDRAAAAVAGIERVEVSQLDLIDPASIDAFTTRYVDSGRPLHILINNAVDRAGADCVDADVSWEQLASEAAGHGAQRRFARCVRAEHRYALHVGDRRGAPRRRRRPAAERASAP
jgi:NAD(P)-dependent dehydrogenase (short-subunit alcohol dehydrogenase family)